MKQLISFLLLTFISACDSDQTPTVKSTSIAESTQLNIASIESGRSVFIKTLTLAGFDRDDVEQISFTILPKQDAIAAPLTVTYSKTKIINDFSIDDAQQTVSFAIFGLYGNYDNQVILNVNFKDKSRWQQTLTVSTEIFIEENDDDPVYTNITINQLPRADSKPSFSYFYLKNRNYSPIVMDIDGNIRWLVTAAASNDAAAFFDGEKFIIGDTKDNAIYHQAFDGSQQKIMLTGGQYSDAVFHHNIDVGKKGFLVELDVTVDGIIKKEAYLAEILADGKVVKEWDLGEIFSAYMISQGDDPSDFVRYSGADGAGGTQVIDWFHMNTATYDPADDSIIISSRENFVVKIDYQSGNIQWLLGDESKYWYQNYPSLRALAPTLTSGNAPIGAHALSIANDGSLLLFNNGYYSQHQPKGEPAGIDRDFSTASKYRISDDNQSYQELWTFNEGELADICSSVYQHRGGDYLLHYSSAQSRTLARVLGLTEDKEILFDIQMPTKGCATSWNATVIELENLIFQ